MKLGGLIVLPVFAMLEVWLHVLFVFSNDLCLNEQVYDVTKFLEDHPGGDDVLLSATGI